MYLTVMKVRDDLVDFQIETKEITLKGDKISLNEGQIISYEKTFSLAISILNEKSNKELNETIELSDMFYCVINSSKDELFLSNRKLKTEFEENIAFKIWQLKELRKMIAKSITRFT